MFGQRDASILQRAIPLAMGFIGIACCVLALLDMRSQQAADRLPARPTSDHAMAGQQQLHHMRGWQLHGTSANGVTHRVGSGAHGLS